MVVRFAERRPRLTIATATLLLGLINLLVLLLSILGVVGDVSR